jgi:hypothetical protein
MKKLLAVLLLLFSAAVSAEDNEIAVMENDAGGSIVLTQRECPIPKSADFRLAYSWTTKMRIFGCWKFQQNSRKVHVLWVLPDGESHHRIYSADNFELMKTI